MIIITFFGKAYPDLYRALATFQREIINLADIYNWQDVVLLLAIYLYTKRYSIGIINIDG
jgi:hypothetical protein